MWGFKFFFKIIFISWKPGKCFLVFVKGDSPRMAGLSCPGSPGPAAASSDQTGVLNLELREDPSFSPS